MSASGRVVITGMGVVSPCGNTLPLFWKSLCEGVSGTGPITCFDCAKFPSRIAGEIKEFDSSFLGRKELKRMDRFVQFAVVAAKFAFDDAQMDLDKEDRDQIGVLIGSGIGGIYTIETEHTTMLQRGPDRLSPFFIPMLIVNMAPGQVSIQFGLRGPNLAVATACATATHAIGEAARILRTGDAQVMVAGGSEAAITPLGIGGFCAMRALSTRNDEPKRASRPFDAQRNGFVMSEGAGIVVLETLEHALSRGARIHAELVGYGLSGDAYHMTSPTPGGEGAARCMEMALRNAKLNKEDLSYINAHGTSTELNDKFETEAIKKVFGARAYTLPVSSTKSMTGHLLGAAGGVELIASVLAVEHNIIPPTINYENPDPECDLDYVPNTAREAVVETAMSNSLGFGGHNTSLVVKKFRG